MLTVASWNVNSLKARLPLISRYLDEQAVDILCLQETRSSDAAFPRHAFEERGYHVVTAGRGGYAGVAVASRAPIDDVTVGIAGFDEEGTPGRRIACRTGNLRVDNVYVPTRLKIGKEAFLEALRADRVRWHDAANILAGDFNICFDARDYASPNMIADAEVHPRRPEDLAFRRLLGETLVDSFRRIEPASGHHSWFPVTPWALKRNYGMRLDYIFASPSLADHLVEVRHDRETRSWPRPLRSPARARALRRRVVIRASSSGAEQRDASEITTGVQIADPACRQRAVSCRSLVSFDHRNMRDFATSSRAEKKIDRPIVNAPRSVSLRFETSPYRTTGRARRRGDGVRAWRRGVRDDADRWVSACAPESPRSPRVRHLLSA